MSSYMPAKAYHGFKPYDRRQAKRDIHDAGQVSRSLSGQLRRRAKRKAYYESVRARQA